MDNGRCWTCPVGRCSSTTCESGGESACGRQLLTNPGRCLTALRLHVLRLRLSDSHHSLSGQQRCCSVVFCRIRPPAPFQGIGCGARGTPAARCFRPSAKPRFAPSSVSVAVGTILCSLPTVPHPPARPDGLAMRAHAQCARLKVIAGGPGTWLILIPFFKCLI